MKYLVDPFQAYPEVLEERDELGNLIARYDYGDDLVRMVRGGTASYYLFDGLGSTRALTSLAGAVTDTYLYDAYGNLLSQTGNSYLFNGQQYDGNAGLYYVRARYYNRADGECGSSGN